tara:strand:+ start:211 stop:390 length:180 start_codon:yes stop_codon:yes gene_type:complete
MNTAAEIALIMTASSTVIASLIYALRHIKESTCCGSKCTQVVVDAPQCSAPAPVSAPLP